MEQCFRIDRELTDLILEMSPEELRGFREAQEAQEEPCNDDQIELDIFTLMILGARSTSAEDFQHAMEQAVQQAESWAAEPATSAQEQARRMRIFDNVLAMKLQLE